MCLDHQKKNLKETRLKLHNTLALPVLLYGSETWTIKARDARRITAAEMKYVGNSISKLQIQVTTYVFELSAGNCHC